MLYFEADDGRICLVYDYLGLALVGSTDIKADNPDEVRCEPDEVDYLLDSVRTLLPGMTFDRDQIVYAYSGIRPLPASDASLPGLISRDHSAPVAGAGPATGLSRSFRWSAANGRPFAALPRKSPTPCLTVCGAAVRYRRAPCRSAAARIFRPMRRRAASWLARLAREIGRRGTAVSTDCCRATAPSHSRSRRMGRRRGQALPDFQKLRAGRRSTTSSATSSSNIWPISSCAAHARDNRLADRPRPAGDCGDCRTGAGLERQAPRRGSRGRDRGTPGPEPDAAGLIAPTRCTFQGNPIGLLKDAPHPQIPTHRRIGIFL